MADGRVWRFGGLGVCRPSSSFNVRSRRKDLKSDDSSLTYSWIKEFSRRWRAVPPLARRSTAGARFHRVPIIARALPKPRKNQIVFN